MYSSWVIRRTLLVVALLLAWSFPVAGSVLAEGGLKGENEETPPAETPTNERQNLSGWTSELLGVEVTWDEAWTFSVARSTVPGEEQLRLYGPGGGITNVWIREEGRGGPPEDVAAWKTDEFLEGEYVQGASIEVLLSDVGSATSPGASLNMVSTAGMAEWLAGYRESHPAGEAGVYVAMGSSASEWEADYAALPGIEIDGIPVGQVLDPSEVADAVAGYTPVPFSEEAAGLVSNQSWVSPQCGKELVWTGDLEVTWVDSSANGADEIILEPERTADDLDSVFVVADPIMATDSLLDELDRWTSPEYYDVPPGTEGDYGVLLQETPASNSGERLSAFGGGATISWSLIVLDDNGCDIYIDVTASSDEFVDLWQLVVEHIELDGEAIPSAFSVGDIEDAIENGLD